MRELSIFSAGDISQHGTSPALLRNKPLVLNIQSAPDLEPRLVLLSPSACRTTPTFLYRDTSNGMDRKMASLGSG